MSEASEVILARSLPPLPERLGHGACAPIGAWRGDGFGAVLWLCHLGGEEFGTNCVVLQGAGTEWTEHSTSGASGGGIPCAGPDGEWCRPDHYGFPAISWVADFIHGVYATGVPVDPDPDQDIRQLRIVAGIASPDIAGIHVAAPGRPPIIAPAEVATGVGTFSEEPLNILALDQDGEPLRDRDEPVRWLAF